MVKIHVHKWTKHNIIVTGEVISIFKQLNGTEEDILIKYKKCIKCKNMKAKAYDISGNKMNLCNDYLIEVLCEYFDSLCKNRKRNE